MFGAHAGLRIANGELGEESNSVVLWQAARIAGHSDPTFVILSEAKNLLFDGSESGRPFGLRAQECARHTVRIPSYRLTRSSASRARPKSLAIARAI